MRGFMNVHGYIKIRLDNTSYYPPVSGSQDQKGYIRQGLQLIRDYSGNYSVFDSQNRLLREIPKRLSKLYHLSEIIYNKSYERLAIRYEIERDSYQGFLFIDCY